MTQPSFSCPRCGYETFRLFDIESGRCPFCSHEPTRAEVETDWFGAPVGGAPGYVEIAPGAFDREHPPLSALPPLRVARGGISADGAPVTTCDLEADLEESLRDPAFRASYEAAEARSAAARSPAPTFRVARFVQALRRLRR